PGVADGAGAAGFAGAATGICTSAEASWKVAGAGLERGTGTGLADLAGTAAAIRLAADGFAVAETAPLSSSSSAAGLLLNSEANRLGLLVEVEPSSPAPRFSISAL